MHVAMATIHLVGVFRQRHCLLHAGRELYNLRSFVQAGGPNSCMLQWQLFILSGVFRQRTLPPTCRWQRANLRSLLQAAGPSSCMLQWQLFILVVCSDKGHCLLHAVLCLKSLAAHACCKGNCSSSDSTLCLLEITFSFPRTQSI